MTDSWAETDDEPLINIAQAVSTFSTATANSEITNIVNSSDDDEPLVNYVHAAGVKVTSETVSSDDEPLAKIAAGASRFSSSSDHDDIERDPDWCHSDTLTSDHATPLTNILPHARKRKKADKQIETAKLISSGEARELRRQQEEHGSKLDNILSANGFYRVPVPPFGNCFFEAVLPHLDGIDAKMLRSILCDHLDDNLGEYIDFLPGDISDENETYLRYFLNVSQLRAEGEWSNDAADLLPLALANYAKRTVKIFTSDLYKPLLIIEPTQVGSGDEGGASGGQSLSQPITISLLELPDRPHYDTVLSLKRAEARATCPSNGTSSSQDQCGPKSPVISGKKKN